MALPRIWLNSLSPTILRAARTIGAMGPESFLLPMLAPRCGLCGFQ